MDRSMMVMPTTNQPANIQVSLTPEKEALVPQIVANYNIADLPGQHLVVFGQEAVNQFSQELDALLQEITKAQSPQLFEMFRKLSGDISKLNMPKLEAQVRRKLQGGKFSRAMDLVHLGNKARRLEKKASEARALLQSKETSLDDLVKKMESKVNEQCQAQIADISRLTRQAEKFKKAIEDLAVYVQSGQEILAHAEEDLAKAQAKAQSTNAEADIDAARELEFKVEVFKNRQLALETAYAEVPVNLQAIRLTQTAGLRSLASTISDAQTAFNSIKSTLITLNSIYTVRTLQDLTDQYRQIRSATQEYSMQQLGEVSVKSVRDAADARLEAARQLSANVQKLNQITATIEVERQKSQQKLETAKGMLVQAQQLMVSLDKPAPSPMLGSNVTVKLS